MMRVAVDLRAVHPGLTGIGRYAQNLFLSLEKLGDRISLLGITSEAGKEFLRGVTGAPVRVVPTREPRWEETGLPELLRNQKAEVYHTPLFILPSIRTCAFVSTIHDVIPLACPHLATPDFAHFFHANLPATLRRASHIVTVSEFARKDCLRLCQVAPDRISAIHEPVSPFFRPIAPGESARPLAELGLSPGFILSVGALDRRKNLGGLLEAYRLLRTELPDAPALAVVGGPSGDGFDLESEIRERVLSNHVRALGRVPDRTLPHLYSSAALFAFPSFYEGFGLPVLEAMASGTPVVASRSTSLPEVAGDAALLVDPENPGEIKEALSRVLRDPELRADLARRGLSRASLFSLERQGERLYELYSRLAA